MISTLFNSYDYNTTNAIKHIMNNLKYDNLIRGLQNKDRYPEYERKIVLFEYVHSEVKDNVAEIEMVPNTRMSVHSFIECRNTLLRTLFASSPNMNIYTRRHIDPLTNVPTKYRQLVLHIPADPPSPILLNPELDYAFLDER